MWGSSSFPLSLNIQSPNSISSLSNISLMLDHHGLISNTGIIATASHLTFCLQCWLLCPFFAGKNNFPNMQIWSYHFSALFFRMSLKHSGWRLSSLERPEERFSLSNQHHLSTHAFIWSRAITLLLKKHALFSPVIPWPHRCYSLSLESLVNLSTWQNTSH